jgi:hypothetical protein
LHLPKETFVYVRSQPTTGVFIVQLPRAESSHLDEEGAAMSLLLPNSTQIPNVLLDLLMPCLRDSERSVLLYICRRTYGFQREADAISLSQFVDGLRSTQGRQLDLGCGVSRAKVVEALQFFQATGLVERLAGGVGRTHIGRYRINLQAALVQKLNLLQEIENPREKIVYFLNQFRKGLESKPFPPQKGPRSAQKKVSKVNLQNQGKEKRNQDRLLTHETKAEDEAAFAQRYDLANRPYRP